MKLITSCNCDSIANIGQFIGKIPDDICHDFCNRNFLLVCKLNFELFDFGLWDLNCHLLVDVHYQLDYYLSKIVIFRILNAKINSLESKLTNDEKLGCTSAINLRYMYNFDAIFSVNDILYIMHVGTFDEDLMPKMRNLKV